MKDHPIPAENVERMRRALGELFQAYRYARALGRPVWDFAVELDGLRAVGLTNTDLRYLLSQGLVEHARETAARGKARRAFRRIHGWAIPAETCVVLTAAGAGWLERLPSGTTAPGHYVSTMTPRWDGARRELVLGTHIVKRFRQPAQSQELILAAFEEEGWPESILDPLPPQPGYEQKGRLHQTITNLNRWQKRPGVHFFGNGGGSTVCWEPRG